jgi:hypothetical protein
MHTDVINQIPKLAGILDFMVVFMENASFMNKFIDLLIYEYSPVEDAVNLDFLKELVIPI